MFRFIRLERKWSFIEQLASSKGEGLKWQTLIASDVFSR